MSYEPKLQPGVGFHLAPSGQWKPEDIPPDVLRDVSFSGYLTIQGYRCTVFETKKKEQWAQKSTGTSALAARVAARYLRAKGSDLVSQVQEIVNDERQDNEYDDAIVDFCDKAFSALEELNNSVTACLEQFAKTAEKLGEHDHERVQQLFAPQMKQALLEAAQTVKGAGDGAILEISKDLKKLKGDASRRG